MRGTGKTRTMVEGLPETGATVIVPHRALREYVRRMILDLRGRAIFEACQVVVVDRSYCAITAMQGRSGPFIVDHAFWDYADRQTAALAREYLHAIEARAA